MVTAGVRYAVAAGVRYAVAAGTAQHGFAAACPG
jgi:hypothetical protein